MDDLEPYVKVCFECFSADWNLLRSLYSGYTRWEPETTVYDLFPPYFAGDDVRANKLLSTSDMDGVSIIDPSVFKPFNKDTNAQNKLKRVCTPNSF